ncbi:hypothetical protein EI77_02441 [Prosthecobacter fusiformis]|uniref:Uncharacterized protein n=1 Tax=Prosthecobacter fusiformis TaxID=48464 RepID=A0A4R7S1M7_9BACT|nr:hypothetical protein EI77_02441 [Prosthecobacter fusiformis]
MLDPLKFIMTPYYDPTGDEIEYRYFCYLANFGSGEKDLKLLSVLLATDRLDEAKVRQLAWSVEMEENGLSKPSDVLMRWGW